MRDISPELQALMDGGKLAIRGMIAVDLPSGTRGFWDGEGPWTWNGIVFVGGAQLLEIESVEEMSGTAAASQILRLRALPDLGLTTDVLATIEDENYHRRPVTEFVAYFDVTTRNLIEVEPVFRGRIDRLTHVDDPEDGAYLEVELVSMAGDYMRTGVRKRSLKDQQAIFPGDRFFEHVGDVGIPPVYWGQEAPKSLRNGSGSDR